MTCPKFVDFTRECIKDIEFVPVNTMKLCSGEDYVKCPFFLILNNDPIVCKNISKCPAFKNFNLEVSEDFLKISGKFCTSKGHKNCQRYILKEKGEEVPKNLHPDGHIVDDW
jgi:uncharacterized protein YlzI (FlbEa/FlbD family)